MNRTSRRSGSGSPYTWLLPWQVRERRFRPARFGRRGLDPDEVRAFLDQVAGDLAAAYNALAASRQEAARIVDLLRRQNIRYDPRPARHRTDRHNQGRWT